MVVSLPFFLQIQWTVQGWVLSKGWPSAGERVSSVLWCMVLMHDSWSRHAIMQIISTHWTNTMFGIGLSKSSSAWRNLIVFPHPSPNHVKPMWRRCGIMSKKLTSKWHGLNVSVCVFPFYTDGCTLLCALTPFEPCSILGEQPVSLCIDVFHF